LLLVNLLAGGDCTAAILQRAHWRSNDRSTQLGLFACSGLWVFLVFTIAATKLPSYVLPLMPAAAIPVRRCYGARNQR